MPRPSHPAWARGSGSDADSEYSSDGVAAPQDSGAEPFDSDEETAVGSDAPDTLPSAFDGPYAYPDYGPSNGSEADVSDLEYEAAEIEGELPALSEYSDAGSSTMVDSCSCSENEYLNEEDEGELALESDSPPAYDRVCGWGDAGAADPPGYDTNSPPAYEDVLGMLYREVLARRAAQAGSAAAVPAACNAATSSPNAAAPSPNAESSTAAENAAPTSAAPQPSPPHTTVHGTACRCPLCTILYAPSSPVTTTAPLPAPATRVSRLRSLAAPFHSSSSAAGGAGGASDGNGATETTPLNGDYWGYAAVAVAPHGMRRRRRREPEGPTRFDIACEIIDLRANLGWWSLCSLMFVLRE